MVKTDKFREIKQVQEGLKSAMYICSRQIATTVYLAHNLEKPILVEGPAGVGKTELAKVTAEYLNLPLIRIQCYEGLDESKALYEWKYGKQLLYTQLLKDKLDTILSRKDKLADSISKLHQYDDIFFSSHFLEPRPLLKALQQTEVAAAYAKYQELSLNPQKLAGQCSKLKCCLNYELDCYVDAQRSFPPRDVPLEAMDCTAYFQKLEVHKGLYWYSTDPHSNANLIALPVQRVRDIQALNRQGKKVDKLKLVDEAWELTPVSQDLLKNNSLTRFDPPENKNPQKKNPHRKKNRRFNDNRNK